MSKIYEALEYAQQEQQRFEEQEFPLPHSPIFPRFPKPSELQIENEMIRVYQAINSLLPDSQKRIIQFIGSLEGEGTSTIVREFARVSAMKIDKSVLLLDADRHKSSQHLFFDIEPKYGWDDVIRDTMSMDNALHQIGETSLFISPISENSTSPQVFNSSKFDAFLEELKERFDLILVDSPPATTSSDALAISPKADGILLVLEAEKTRLPVVESARDRIIKSGGNILGVILNKRRYHIPEFIYKRL